jgi:CelD/BcsL family acetyltransferase involved in cellulose biosynthesis
VSSSLPVSTAQDSAVGGPGEVAPLSVAPLSVTVPHAAVEIRAFDADVGATLGDDVTVWKDMAHRWGTTFQQLPEYARLHLQRPEIPRDLPGFWMSQGDAQGVLLPKRLPVGRTISAVAGGMSGYWLAGNGVFGAGAEGALGNLVSTAASIVQREHAAFLLLEDVDIDSPLDMVARGLAQEGWTLFTPTGWQPRWRIHLPATADEYWSKFNSKRRGNLRRQQRKLGGEVRRFTEPDSVDEFLSLAHTVSLRTWQTRTMGLRVGNSEFERAAYRLATDEGRFLSYVLVKDGQPISFAIGTTAGSRYLLEEIGYDPAFADWSPGMTLLCHMLDDFYLDRPPALFDFGGGDASYKRTLANAESQSATLWLIAPGWRRQGAMQLFKWLRSATKASHRLIGDGGLRARLRRMFRGAAGPVSGDTRSVSQGDRTSGNDGGAE